VFVAGFIASNSGTGWESAPLVAAAGAFALAIAGFYRFWVKRDAISAKERSKRIDLMADV
jgi:hypothetical protein